MFKNSFKKLLSFLLVMTVVFSAISGAIIPIAAESVSSIDETGDIVTEEDISNGNDSSSAVVPDDSGDIDIDMSGDEDIIETETTNTVIVNNCSGEGNNIFETVNSKYFTEGVINNNSPDGKALTLTNKATPTGTTITLEADVDTVENIESIQAISINVDLPGVTSIVPSVSHIAYHLICDFYAIGTDGSIIKKDSLSELNNFKGTILFILPDEDEIAVYSILSDTTKYTWKDFITDYGMYSFSLQTTFDTAVTGQTLVFDELAVHYSAEKLLEEYGILTEDKHYSDFSYELINGKVTITDCDTSVSGEIAVPSEMFNSPVTEIGAFAFSDCTAITGIFLPDSITTIGENSFHNCASLTNIIIPDTVTLMGSNVFGGCTALTDIYYLGTEDVWNDLIAVNGNSITATVHFIGDNGNDDIENNTINISDQTVTLGTTEVPVVLTINSTTGFNMALVKLSSTIGAVTKPVNIISSDHPATITYPEGTTDYGSFFIDAMNTETADGYVLGNVTSATIEVVFAVGADVVVGDYDVVISRTEAASVNEEVFDFVCNTGKITVDEAVETVDFEYTVTDGEVTITKYIGNASEVVIPSEIEGYPVTTIGSNAFIYCNSVTSIVIPETVTTLCVGAFTACGSLISIVIPETVTDIGDYIFQDCGSLQTVTLPEGITNIPNGLFYYCGSLSSVTIPESVTAIGSNAFYSCTSLTSINIPVGVKNIGAFAFCVCDNLTDVYYNAYPSQWNEIVIEGANECLTNATIHFIECECEFDDWITRIEPTCTTDGEQYRTCSKCGAEETQIIGASGHNFENSWFYTCNHTEDSGAVELPEIDWYSDSVYIHNFYKHRTCSICGMAETLPADNEIELSYGYCEPTCTENGYNYTDCDICGNRFIENETAATGHSYSIANVFEPDCINEGYTEYYCDTCGVRHIDNKVSALGHDYEITVIAPDCFNEGYTVYNCNRCGDNRIDNYTSKTNHNFVTNPDSSSKETTYICDICSIPCADIYTTSGNKISNDYLVFAVNGYKYALHTTGGDPDLSTDNNARLLYGDIGSGTSDSIININGATYAFIGIKDYINAEGDSIYSYNIYDGVLVQRYCSFVYNIYTQRKDTLEIKFVFTNIADNAATAGTRIFFDTMLGSNDSAPFRIPGQGDITYEKEYIGENIPQIWQVFNSLSNPTVLASGTFYENVNERPDKIQFILYGRGSSDDWNCTVGGNSFGDSAVNIYFNPTAISAGESRTVKTFYGLSEFSSTDDELSAVVTVPSELLLNDANNAYRNNPFTINGWIVNNSSDITYENITATLVLPDGLVAKNQELRFNIESLAANANQAFSWSLTALNQFKSKTLTYKIVISADGENDVEYIYTIDIPALPASLCPHEAFGEWIIDYNPTCEATGSKHRICADCDTVETVVIDALGHSFGEWNDRCSHEYIPLLPGVISDEIYRHIYERFRTCYVCSEEEVIALDSSVYEFISDVIAPTCTDSGYTVHTCSLCHSFSYEDSYVSPLGHIYTSVLTEPTYFTQGYTTYTCSRCGHSYIDNYVDALDRTDIAEVTFELEYTHTYYKGRPLTPEVYYINSEGILVGIDGEFTARYINNNKVGTATVIIEGINKYIGTSELNFDITYEVIPEKILNVIAVGEIGKISLAWAESAEYNTDKYNIYRKAEDENNFVLIKTVYGRDNTSFEDYTAQREKTYYYYVTGIGLYGAESEASAIVSGMVQIDREAPIVLKVNPSTGSVISGKMTLSAKATDNISVVKAEYYYSIDGGESWILIGSTTNSALSILFDSTVVSGTSVKIKVTASDAEGNVSEGYIADYSVDNIGPDKVTGLAATSLSSKLTLTWNDVKANDAAYFILKVKKNDVWTVVASNITTKGYTLTNLQPDTEYTFIVACVDVYGNVGEYSDEFTARTAGDTTAPVITNQSPAPSRFNSTITFSATAKDDCNIATIEIQVSTDLISWTTISTKNFTDKNYSRSYSYTIDLSSYSDGSLYVRAIATDFAGNVSDTSSAAPFTEYIVDKMAPLAPQNVAANGNDGYITVSWSVGNEGDLGRYFIYRATALDGEYVLIASNLSSLNYHDRNVDDSTEYFYKVRVNDSCGNMSDYSVAVSATVTPDTKIPEITSISTSFEQKISDKNHTITVSAADNNKLSYVVVEYYTSNNAQYTQLIKKENINSHYVDVSVKLPISGLVNGDFITVRAYAVDMAGQRSEYATAKYILDTVAPQINDFTAVINNSKVTLSWKDNGESDISGFKVYRSTNGTTFTFVGTRGVKSSGVYSFIDTITAQTSGTYIYKLEAIDRIGNSSDALVSVEYNYEDNYVYVNTPPAALMQIPAYLTVGVEEMFDGSASYDNKIIVKYLWDFGDGTTSTDIRPIKKYTAVGVYNITLTVTDNEGLSTTVTGSVEVKERETIGSLIVRVVDENGNALSNFPVYFDLGSDSQRVIYTDTSGRASLQMSSGTHVIGAYSAGYLPVKKDVVVLSNATRTITLTTVEEEIVTGQFEITRMTFDEIIAAGIDVYDPANQHVYSATVRVRYGSTPPVNIHYIRNNNKIINYTITDSNGNPTDRYTNGSGEDRIITGVTYIGGGSGFGGSGGSSDCDVVAILDIPASASYLKEFFDVKLHIINNAAYEFELINNEVELHIPNGMTLMKSVKGDYYTSTSVFIPSIRGQQTKTLAWILRGDLAGEYNLSADFEGTLAEFNEIVSATFKTEKPIKVYGLEGVKFRILAADRIYNDTLYFNVELENQRDIDIYMPSIGFTEKIYNVTESVLNDNPDGDFDADTFLLNVYIQYENGEKLYLPVIFDDNNKVVLNIDVLAPGQKLVYEYVVYNAINYAGIAYFKDAAITEFEGLIENIEVGSFSKEYYSFNDYTGKLDTILNGSNPDVNKSYNYIMSDANYYYITEANGINVSVLESLYELGNTLINFDLSSLTQEEERDLVKRLLFSLLSESSVIEQSNDLMLYEYRKAAITMLNDLQSGITNAFFGSDNDLIKIKDAFKGFIDDSMDFAVTYKTEGLKGFKNKVDRELAEKIGDDIKIDKKVIDAYQDVKAFKDVIDIGGKVLDVVLTSANNAKREAAYFAMLKLQCNYEIAKQLLDILIAETEAGAVQEMTERMAAGLLPPTMTFALFLKNGLGEGLHSIIYQEATAMRADLEKSIEDYNEQWETVKQLIYNGAIELAEIGLEKIVTCAIGSTPLILITLGFNVLDGVLGWGNYVQQHDALQVYAALSKVYKKAFLANSQFREDENDFYTMLFLRAICEMRLNGEDQFKKFIYDYYEGKYRLPLSEQSIIKYLTIGGRFDTLDEWADDMQYNIVSSRDRLFNIEAGTNHEKPRAPVVTLNYETLQTVQTFSDEYEYCFGDGEWKSCNNAPISFEVDTVPSTIRVRKAASDSSLAGEITTVRIFARKDLSKLITVKYDGENYLFDNLTAERYYQVLFLDSPTDEIDWNNSVTIAGSYSTVKLIGYEGFNYVVIRSCQNSDLLETTSNPLTVKVDKKQALSLVITGKGSVIQTSASGTYFAGDTIDLVAVPYSGNNFVGWYINNICVSTDTHYIAEMENNLKIKAVFSGSVIEEIVINSLPTKLSYYEDEELNLTGLVVSAVYSDGSIYEISDYTVRKLSSVAGITKVEIAFGDKTTYFDIEILHKLSGWIIILPATHFEEGMKIIKCYVCGKIIESEIIPIIEHSYTEQIIAPTCTESGYTLYTCSCGHSYKDNYVAATGHSFGDWLVRINATCTEKGLEYRVCNICNHEETREITATGHSFGDWFVRIDATCTENGLEYRVCSSCNCEETREIAAIGHIYQAIVTAPDCVNGGYTTHTCSNCGDSYVDSYVEALGHTYSDEWTVDVEPTYTTEGSKSRHCLYCDSKTDITAIPAIGVVLEYTISDGEAIITGYQGNAQNLVIPSTINGYKVTTIANDAFYNNKNLVNVIISNSVTYIGYWAFDNCDNIVEVTFEGSRLEWDNITVAYGNKALTEADIRFIGDIVIGDSNNDSIVNSIDLVSIKKQLVNVTYGDNLESEVVDVNNDGEFDVRDLIRVKKIIAGVDVNTDNVETERVNSVYVEVAYVDKNTNYLSVS